MRGFFGWGVYNGIETQPGGGEDVQEQEMIAQLLQQDERGMEALLLHYGPLMRYIIAPILPDPQDREECLSEVSMRVWSRVAQFDPARGSWTAWLTAITRNTALNFQRSVQHHSSVQSIPEGTPAPTPPPRKRFCRRSAAPPCTMRWAGSRPGTGRCFTESIITYSPPRRSRPSWA